MEQFLKRIENLLTVKSIVTLALTAVFACQAVRGEGFDLARPPFDDRRRCVGGRVEVERVDVCIDGLVFPKE